jgi:hypothetical protein
MKSFFAALSVVVVIVLAGCGSTPTTTSNGAGDTTSPTPTTQAGTMNPSAPTSTSGPIRIITDHTQYAPTDAITVTITNTNPTSIYTLDHQASCSVFTLEREVNSAWQLVVDVARCVQGRPTTVVELKTNSTQTYHIFAGALRQGDARFAPGGYRLKLNYATAPVTAAGQGALSNETVSQTFTISADVPPQPIPTPPPSGGATSVGTVTPIGTVKPFDTGGSDH